MYTHITNPPKQTSRVTMKTSQYAEFRTQVKSTFDLSTDETDFILPKKAKCHQSKFDTGVITYSIDVSCILAEAMTSSLSPTPSNDTMDDQEELPLFFSTYEYLGPPTQAEKLKQIKQNKLDTTLLPLIPTIFALWRLPSLLPPAFIPESVMPKITGTKPTQLYTPGLQMPDLPDAFLIQGALQPKSFFDLFPNNYNYIDIQRYEDEHYDKLNALVAENPAISNNPNALDACEQVLTSYRTKYNLSPIKAFQQTYYPFFFNNKSFNYVLQPSQMRAVYVTNNPYAIGVGFVDDKYDPLETYTLPSELMAQGDYISPWSKSDFIPTDLLKQYNDTILYKNENKAGTDPTVKKNNKNSKNSLPSASNNFNALLTDLLKWPRNNNPFDATILAQEKSKIDPNTHIIYDLDISTLPKTLPFAVLLEKMLHFLSLYQKTNKITNNPMSIPFSVLANGDSFSEMFPMNNNINTILNTTTMATLLGNAISTPNGEAGNKKSKKLQNTNSPNPITLNPNTKNLNRKQQQELTETANFTLNTAFVAPHLTPSIGYASNHPENVCDMSHFCTIRALSHTRPYPANHTITMLHCLNDAMTEQYKSKYPVDGFLWQSTTKCVTKPHNKFVLVQKCTMLVLHLMWLLCVCKPCMKLEKSHQPLDTEGVMDNNEADVVNIKQLQTEVGELSSIVEENTQKNDENDENIAKNDDINDDDDENEEITPCSDEIICKSCYTARFEWGLQFALDQHDTFPFPMSDLPKYLRATSNCPSSFRHVFSKSFTAQQSQNKNAINSNSKTILCTCTNCAQFVSSNLGNISNIDSAIGKCLCANYDPKKNNQKIELSFNNNKYNTSPYHKISQLAKYAEKMNWMTTKAYNKTNFMVLSKAAKFEIRSTLQDKRYFEQYLNGGTVDDENDNISSENTSMKSNAPSSTSFQSATVQVIHGVTFSQAMKTFLENLPDYSPLISFGRQKLIHQATNNITNIQSDSTAQPTLTFKSIGSLSYEMGLLDVLSFLARALQNVSVGNDTLIKKAILDYVKSNKLTVVVQNGSILSKSNPNISEDALPPIAKAQNRGKSVDQGVTHSQYLNAFPKNKKLGCQPSDSDSEGSIDEPAYKPSNTIQFSDDEDNLPPVINNKKLSKFGNAILPQKGSKDAKVEQQKNSEQKIDNGKRQKQQLGNSKPEVYLCYDPALYKALGLSKSQNYSMANLETLIISQLTPVTSTCNEIIRYINTLTSNTEFVKYLIDLYSVVYGTTPRTVNLSHDQREHQILLIQQNMMTSVKKATAALISGKDDGSNPLASQQRQLIECVQISNNPSFKSAISNDIRVIQSLMGQLSFKNDKNIVLENKSKPTTQRTVPQTVSGQASSLPTIMMFSTRIKGKLVTLAVGFEMFGISPKDLATNSSFKTYISCAVSTVDMAEEPKIKMLFPASINPKCHIMLMMQGDQCEKFQKYAIKHLRIAPESIHALNNKGQKRLL